MSAPTTLQGLVNALALLNRIVVASPEAAHERDQAIHVVRRLIEQRVPAVTPTNTARIIAHALLASGAEVDEEAVARAEALCDAPADVICCKPGYASLADVLNRAFAQAATGKGSERHAQGQPFERQPMQDLIRLHGVGFATGQASKKAQEAHRLPRARAVAELLGSINYLAGAIIAIEAGDTHHKA